MDIVKLLIGIGVGLIDEGVTGYRVAGVAAEDVARAGVFFTGLALDLAGRGPIKEVGEALEVAAAPLLTKTVAKYVRRRAYAPRIREVREVRALAPAPAPAPVAGLTSY
jgi:hypothetical protein